MFLYFVHLLEITSMISIFNNNMYLLKNIWLPTYFWHHNVDKEEY